MKNSNKLNQQFITHKTNKQGKSFSDGNGLYLQVSNNMTKTWVFRYKYNGKSRRMGLGSVQVISLQAARKRALKLRVDLTNGNDPLDKKNKAKEDQRKKEAKRVLFKDYAEEYIKDRDPSWTNKKHKSQWRNTLAMYAYPVFGNTPIADIDTLLICEVLKPIWNTKTETATRVRQRIEAILDAATTIDLREGPNPARWKGHLDKLFAKPSKVMKKKHHSSLPFNEVSAFIVKLQEHKFISPKALEFLILTASRTSEVIGMKWEEVLFNKKLWVIPAERMKAGREHVVPLSKRAIEILGEMKQIEVSEYVFNSPLEGGKPLSNMAMLVLLQKRMGYKGITVHGFRSTFRDWVSEETNHQGEVAEMALAHTVRGVEGDYRRGNLLKKRRDLMDDWGKFVTSYSNKNSNVISIKSSKSSNQAVATTI